MRRILRSKGKTVTGIGVVRGNSTFSRGLRRSDEKFRPKSAQSQIEYDLAKFLTTDEKSLMGQIISLLDKTIRKTTRLRDMNAEAYLHRANLGNELLVKFVRKIEQDRKPKISDEDLDQLKTAWAWKVHPYKGYKPVLDDVPPESDENYRSLLKNREVEPMEEFQGTWHKEFWPRNMSGAPRHSEIAERMWSHLTKNEIKLHNSPWTEVDGPEVRESRMIENLQKSGGPTGLTGTRGERISQSVRDPRISRKEQHGMKDGEPWHFRAVDWMPEEAGIYFRTYALDREDEQMEIAERIFQYVTRDRNDAIRSKDFGRWLWEHFDSLRDKTDALDAPERKRLWSLHNHVRAFYQSIAKSQRFRIADRATGERELVVDAQTRIKVDDRQYQLAHIVPRNKTELLAQLDGKKRNADVGELIRLGKLVVHGADLSLHPDGAELRRLPSEDLTRMFNERLDYLVTSDGQSEIKRNEAFTRVWRNSVALAQRTLKNWVEVDSKKPVVHIDPKTSFRDEDLAQTQVSQAVIERYDTDPETRAKILKHANVLFGADAVGPNGESRASIIVSDIGETPESKKSNNEILWAFLRISAELRNRTNHFCTKERLVDLVTGRSDRIDGGESNDAIVQPADITKTGLSGAHRVDKGAVATLDRLLGFDKHLGRKVIVDELNALNFNGYCAQLLEQFLSEPSDKIREKLLQEICKNTLASKVTYPKFNSVARMAINLAKDNLAAGTRIRSPLAALRLDNADRTTPSANKFQVETFRMLYHGGFRVWVEQGCPLQRGDAAGETRSIAELISRVVGEKKTRTEISRQDQGWIHVHADTIIETLGLQTTENPFEFLQQLNAESIVEERLNQTYQADPRKQREVANRVERFKQEITLVMFETYLEEMGFHILTDIEENEELLEATKLGIDDLVYADEWVLQHWHSRFYAWLYLVPVEDISSLRLQLMKTRALERKSFREADQSPTDAIADADPELDNALDDMDRLMALYGRVNTAGFDGTEHVDGLSSGELFYDDASQFQTMLDADAKTHDVSLAGTRRGLRQMLRFSHTEALSKIIDRHRVTSTEFEALTNREVPEIQLAFDARRNIHQEIVKACKIDPDKPNEKPDWDAVKFLCNDYKEHVTDTTLHDFSVAAARLTEFSRLHQMMMRMIGRLADYSLLWERDMIYLFMGLLYREQKDKGASLQLSCNPLKGDGIAQGYRGNRVIFKLGAKLDGQEIAVDLWGDRGGFLGLPFEKLDDRKERREQINLYLKQTANSDLLWRYWNGTEHPNGKDEDANKLRSQRKQRGRHDLRNADGYQKIRNDFAHFNMITKKGGRLNLTYQVNAVRSLFGYDRKLKNAVSKSIIRIAQQAGVDLDFVMGDDRLTKARALPALQRHLTMAPASKVVNGQCSIPRASIRFTSMVRALFDHDKGGNRDLVTLDGDRTRKGILAYPSALADPEGAPIPTRLRTASLPIYIQKSNKMLKDI